MRGCTGEFEGGDEVGVDVFLWNFIACNGLLADKALNIARKLV